VRVLFALYGYPNHCPSRRRTFWERPSHALLSLSKHRPMSEGRPMLHLLASVTQSASYRGDTGCGEAP
jgi:hypothetical protein